MSARSSRKTKKSNQEVPLELTELEKDSNKADTRDIGEEKQVTQADFLGGKIQESHMNFENQDELDSEKSTETQNRDVAKKAAIADDSNNRDGVENQTAPVFKVAPQYDASFTKNYQLTTAREIRMTDEQTDLSTLIMDNNDPDDKDIDVPKVIVGVLLSLIVPGNNDVQVTYSFSQKKNGYSKKHKATSSFKRMYFFADINCSMSTTFTIIERNNTDHALYWMHDVQKTGVTIGKKFVILAPKHIGVLKTGSTLIETSRPFQMITKPSVPPRLYNTHTVTGEVKYFVIKKTNVCRKLNCSPVAINTQCNAEACDRLKSVQSINAPCGCFGQYQRTGRNGRNVCLKFDFVFQDQRKSLISIDNFTSLKTSRLFFENQVICNDIEQMQCSAVASLVTKSWHKVIKHVNKNGGWTIIGWYVRAAKPTDETTEDTETDKSYYETIKTNVSYLYPTTLKHSDIPTHLLVTQEGVNKALAEANNAQTMTRNMDDDNV